MRSMYVHSIYVFSAFWFVAQYNENYLFQLIAQQTCVVKNFNYLTIDDGHRSDTHQCLKLKLENQCGYTALTVHVTERKSF